MIRSSAYWLILEGIMPAQTRPYRYGGNYLSIISCRFPCRHHTGGAGDWPVAVSSTNLTSTARLHIPTNSRLIVLVRRLSSQSRA
jgi:hypothetical protein